MISIRRYLEEEKEELRDLLNREGINDLDLGGFINLFLEDKRIIGACKIEEVDNKYFMSYLLIGSDHRGNNYGDGLLRASLNSINNLGVEEVYFPKNNEYLTNRGFQVTNDSLCIDIEEFFRSKSSSCCGGVDV